MLYLFVTFPSKDGRARLVVSVSSSVSCRVAALLCRLACLRVRPFRQSRRTRVSSPINTARVSLFAILECTTNRYIHHALRLIIDWVGPAALGIWANFGYIFVHVSPADTRRYCIGGIKMGRQGGGGTVAGTIAVMRRGRAAA